ncbi:MAG: RNA polymerase sigma factor [Bacteroidetes bacterium]|nr:RNA polymerase sigma factor [Bacteroidota bacterium]
MLATVHHVTNDDQLLAQRAGEGDHAAFGTLFERHKGHIYRYCRMMLGDDDAAADIYQEVFINFYRACRTGQVMHNVRGYLITAARSRCLNSLRSSQRLSTLEDDELISYSPDETASDTRDHLQKALGMIPPQYREALVLFELEGYSYDEISKQCDISLGVVKNRIYRAKQALQKILGPILREQRFGESGENEY